MNYKNFNINNVGENIRRGRILRNWTINDLAQNAKIGNKTVYNIEKNVSKNPHLTVLDKIARAFDIPIERLFY